MENILENTVEISYLTPENSSFFVTDNGFLMIDTQLKAQSINEPPKECRKFDLNDTYSKNNIKSGNNGNKIVSAVIGKRAVHLRRAFPFDYPYKYISVSDDYGEIGIILDVDLFGESAEYIKNELDTKYFAPKIIQIVSLKERFGYSYWKVKCNKGDYSFTVKDTFRNIIHVNDKRIFITDVDSNRYEIEDIYSLDRNSFRKIELYL
ncbi:MAG: DUF1854 domain-containing protein [Clostridia bacterium]|nr:DUF1854 domain-containing protein [Clostridia bacterium]